MRLDEIFSRPAKIVSLERRQFYYDRGYQAFPDLIGGGELETLRAATARIVDMPRPPDWPDGYASILDCQDKMAETS